MADQFDRYRGPTGMGPTPFEKDLLDGLAEGPEKAEVKHPEPLEQPQYTGGQYQVGKVTFASTYIPPEPNLFERIVGSVVLAVMLTLVGSFYAFLLWFLFQIVRGILSG